MRIKLIDEDGKVFGVQDDWEVVPCIGDTIVWEGCVLEVESRKFHTEQISGRLVAIDIKCVLLQ